MVQDLCMFSGWEEETDIVWFKLYYPKEKKILASIEDFLENHEVSIIIGHVDNTEPGEIGFFSVFSRVKKGVDLEDLSRQMKELNFVLDVQYGISENRMVHSVDFPMNVLGVRGIIARAKTVVDILKTMYENVQQADGLLVQAGLKGGAHAARYFKSIMSVDMNNMGSVLGELFLAVGWGLLEMEYDYETMTGRIIVKDSFIPSVYGRSEQPVCAYMSGYFAGYLTEVLGKPVQVREVSCKAMGHEACEHLISLVPEARIVPEAGKPEHLIRGGGTDH